MWSVIRSEAIVPPLKAEKRKLPCLVVRLMFMWSSFRDDPFTYSLNTKVMSVRFGVPDVEEWNRAQPSLLINNLDSNSLVVVIFDEPIDTVTFNSSSLQFVNPRTRLGANLSNATIMRTESHGTIIDLVLENDPLNRIKQLNADCRGNLALSVTSSAAEDLYSNPVMPVLITSPLPVCTAGLVLFGQI